MKQQLITETTGRLNASTTEANGKKLAGIISPGQGSSGFYPKDVLEAAGTDKVFPAGTHMYFDHPSESEDLDRPERSVLTIGAVTTEDAHWDESLGMLVAEYEAIAAYKELLEDKTFLGAIGLSIRASAEVEETTEGRIIKRLVEGKSIDFVTHAGRGGRPILELAESARPSTINARALKHAGIEEATVNDKREALSTIVRDEYSDDKTYVWLRDFDDTTAWFDVDSGDDSGTWQQAYTTGEDDLPAALTGDRTEVRVSTTYVPVIPAGPTPTEESEEDTMAETKIEESALADLREKAGRADAAEAARKAAEERAEKAEQTSAAVEARVQAEKHARARVREANATLPAPVVDRIVAEAVREVPLTDEHKLDEAKFDKQVDDAKTAEESYLAGLAEASGAGTILGFGATSEPGEVSESDFDAEFNTEKKGA